MAEEEHRPARDARKTGDDRSMFDDFVAWLSEVLAARDVPAAVLNASLEIVAEVARGSGLVHAARVCTSARPGLAGT